MPPASTTAALNRDTPVYDWYIMPEAYSAPLVNEAMEEFGVAPGRIVLDPFCGTGTTLVAAQFAGRNATGIEVNPFLAFASRVKTRTHPDYPHLKSEAEGLLAAARIALDDSSLANPVLETGLPDMPRLERWISRRVALKALALRRCIDANTSAPGRDVALLALASILRGISNMKLSPHAFGSRQVKQDAPVLQVFELKLRKMLGDIERLETSNGRGAASVVQADIRSVASTAGEIEPADLAITSPPYLNNLDYTMQTRLELFFLGFVKTMDELKQLRKEMMICDAKAMYRDIEDWKRVEQVDSIRSVAAQLDDKLGDRGWGWDYAHMTRQYFGGMLRALEATASLLKPGARAVLVVGESAHSGVLVAVPDLVAELGEIAGFERQEVRVLRTRRSSSHHFGLNESAVILRKP